MNVAERINRILFILSYVSQNQGIPVDKLAEDVGMRPKQLMKELEFISLIGKPPFKPDDYVDIYVENQQVFIEFDQQLNRPLRFTRPEAVVSIPPGDSRTASF
jgi:proteasome accessory factor C